MKKSFLILVLIGVCILIIAPIWTFILLPPQMKMPEDINESVTYTGEAYTANPLNMTQLAGPFNLTIERSYKGIDTAKGGEVLIMNETAVVTIESPLTPVQTETYIMAVDRTTCEHLNEDGADWDYARTGKFMPGFHPEKKDMEFWLHDLNDTVTAEYDGTTTYKGLNVIKYNMNDARQITKNTELIETYAGMAYYYGNSQLKALYLEEDSNIYVEEISGIIVYMDRNTDINGEFTHIPTGMSLDITLSKMSYEFDDDTTDKLISDAKEANSQLYFSEFLMPFMLVIIGVVFLALAVVVKFRVSKKEESVTEEPVEPLE